MKILCDVHISFRVVAFFNSVGIEAVHVNYILNGSRTKDAEIAAFADENDFVVFTKDADFRDSHLLNQTPKKLIKVNLGNISTNDLLQILETNINKMKTIAEAKSFMLEIDSNGLRLTSL